eukprot:6150004-Prymnesium_polylepis.1
MEYNNSGWQGTSRVFTERLLFYLDGAELRDLGTGGGAVICITYPWTIIQHTNATPARKML